MDKDLLSNTSLQISSVTKFSVAVYDQRIDYKAFYRFLRLFLSLVDLELSVHSSLLHDLLKHKNEDHVVEIALTRINQLKIKPSCESDADIHHLFPNIKSVVISDDYGERGGGKFRFCST